MNAGAGLRDCLHQPCYTNQTYLWGWFELPIRLGNKDCWRQVLSESIRIDTKHLVALEAAISEPQTNEMQAQMLQLVVPQAPHETCRTLGS